MQKCGFPRLFHRAKPSVSLRTLKCEGWEAAIAQSQEHLPGNGSFKAWMDAPLHLLFSNGTDTSQLLELLPVSSKAQERIVYLPRCSELPQTCLFHVTTGLYLSCFVPQFFTLTHRANPSSPSLECCREDKERRCLAANAESTCNPCHE